MTALYWLYLLATLLFHNFLYSLPLRLFFLKSEIFASGIILKIP